MTRPCQEEGCGRPANFAAKSRRGKCTGDPAHDLCRRCFRKRLDAINAVERQAGYRQTSRYRAA